MCSWSLPQRSSGLKNMHSRPQVDSEIWTGKAFNSNLKLENTCSCRASSYQRLGNNRVNITWFAQDRVGAFSLSLSIVVISLLLFWLQSPIDLNNWRFNIDQVVSENYRES